MYTKHEKEIILQQLDGNISNVSTLSSTSKSSDSSTLSNQFIDAQRTPYDKISMAASLPTVASYNLRSLFPKIRNFSTDIIERNVDVAF